MTCYQYSNLSPLEFENLAHDMMQVILGCRLESFASGKDDGIDFRHIARDTTIIQCKHYYGSKFSDLISNLKKEQEKINKIKKDRYILVTSKKLTPKNKEHILNLLSPHIKSLNDIYGLTEIEAFLRNNSQILKLHFKLWFSGVPVLQEVLLNSEISNNTFQLEKISGKIKYYVQTDKFNEVINILNCGNVAIISGEPGIGKSTLAEMVTFHLCREGYEPIFIDNDVSEGRTFFSKSRKLVFYFDDFLGSAYLGERHDFVGQNKDKSILDFIEMVQGSKSKFILTTREHILNSSKYFSEKFHNSNLESNKCLIELRNYSRIQKAQILYNHLYFSGLHIGYFEEILKDLNFLKIIDHKNFTPRLIEWICDKNRISEIEPNNYIRHVLSVLENPYEVWRHSFTHQISFASRTILLTLLSLGSYTSLENLEAAWKKFHYSIAANYNTQIKSTDFKMGVKELTGAMIRIQFDNVVSFLNPSIQDFLIKELRSNSDFLEHILLNLHSFKQFALFLHFAEASKCTNTIVKMKELEGQILKSLKEMGAPDAHLVSPGFISIKAELEFPERVELLIKFNEVSKSFEKQKLIDSFITDLFVCWELMYGETSPTGRKHIYFDITEAVNLYEVLVTAINLEDSDKEKYCSRIVAQAKASFTYPPIEVWQWLFERRDWKIFDNLSFLSEFDNCWEDYRSEGFSIELESNWSEDECTKAISALETISGLGINVSTMLEEAEFRLDQLVNDQPDYSSEEIEGFRYTSSRVETNEEISEIFKSLLQ